MRLDTSYGRPQDTPKRRYRRELQSILLTPAGGVFGIFGDDYTPFVQLRFIFNQTAQTPLNGNGRPDGSDVVSAKYVLN